MPDRFAVDQQRRPFVRLRDSQFVSVVCGVDHRSVRGQRMGTNRRDDERLQTLLHDRTARGEVVRGRIPPGVLTIKPSQNYKSWLN